MMIGIEDGDHSVIVPIMAWLLRGKDEHVGRAYLRKYLSKIAIPLDLCADEDVVATYDNVRTYFVGFFGLFWSNLTNFLNV